MRIGRNLEKPVKVPVVFKSILGDKLPRLNKSAFNDFQIPSKEFVRYNNGIISK